MMDWMRHTKQFNTLIHFYFAILYHVNGTGRYTSWSSQLQHKSDTIGHEPLRHVYGVYTTQWIHYDWMSLLITWRNLDTEPSQWLDRVSGMSCHQRCDTVLMWMHLFLQCSRQWKPHLYHWDSPRPVSWFFYGYLFHFLACQGRIGPMDACTL